MAKLFIIGNGFDLAHGLKTSYADFRKFLIAELGGDVLGRPELPERTIHGMAKSSDSKSGETAGETCQIRDIVSQSRFLVWMIDQAARKDSLDDDYIEWNDFEDLLGKLDFESELESPDAPNDVGGRLLDVESTLKQLFVAWMNHVSYRNIKAFFSLYELVDLGRDLFVSFNYTETPELLYRVNDENIFHLHGMRGSDLYPQNGAGLSPLGKNGEPLVFGHGGENVDPNIKFANCSEEIRNSLIPLDQELVKHTDEVVARAGKFLEKIGNANIEQVYSYGFAFSQVDEPQMRAIIESLNGSDNRTVDIVWHLSGYDEKAGKNDNFRRKLRKMGFLGEFGDLFDLTNDRAENITVNKVHNCTATFTDCTFVVEN